MSHSQLRAIAQAQQHLYEILERVSAPGTQDAGTLCDALTEALTSQTAANEAIIQVLRELTVT